MIEILENGVYTAKDENRILCTIIDLGNNIYRAVNLNSDITAEIYSIDEYKTYLRCIENKNRSKDGKYRKSKKLAEHNTRWLAYMLEKKGFIRKSKTTN